VFFLVCSQGDKYLYKEDWGELLVGKIQPVICILDIVSGKVAVIEEGLDKTSSGLVSFS